MPAEFDLGVLLTKWTIRLALVCFVAYLASWLMAGRTPNARWPNVVRWLWTLGCGLFVVHVACAFHFYHHWSHAVAWRTTADQTHELIGVAFGNGIYFSYLFLVLWVGDVVWLWLGKADREHGRPRPLVATLRWAILAFLTFIAFNGAIVFEGGPTRYFGIVLCLLLAGLAGRRTYHWLGSRQDALADPQVREQILMD